MKVAPFCSRTRSLLSCTEPGTGLDDGSAIGRIATAEDREDLSELIEQNRLVQLGESPYYHLREMTHSVPASRATVTAWSPMIWKISVVSSK